MRPDLKLFPAFLVDVRRAQHRHAPNVGRQRDRTPYFGTGTLGCVDDLVRRLIEDTMIERLQPDADVLGFHDCFPL